MLIIRNNYVITIKENQNYEVYHGASHICCLELYLTAMAKRKKAIPFLYYALNNHLIRKSNLCNYMYNIMFYGCPQIVLRNYSYQENIDC